MIFTTLDIQQKTRTHNISILQCSFLCNKQLTTPRHAHRSTSLGQSAAEAAAVAASPSLLKSWVWSWHAQSAEGHYTTNSWLLHHTPLHWLFHRTPYTHQIWIPDGTAVASIGISMEFTWIKYAWRIMLAFHSSTDSWIRCTNIRC